MKQLILFVIFLCVANSFSQNGAAFTNNKQFYLKGNSALIGNNILSISSTEPYNSFKRFNDRTNLKYIDVDNNPKTFNSSQAKLQFATNNNKVVYAALYWSAIYKYDLGVKKVKKNGYVYKEKEKRKSGINQVLFKLPKGEYRSIDGEIVFDSYTTKLFKKTKPYVCYADVTSIIKDASLLNGFYTVANIKATQGYVDGGSSGGWLLYVIYENNTESLKSFTSYNGFVGVNKDAFTIDFKNFKTNKLGMVNTSLLLGVLEGDSKFKTDRCEILNINKKLYIPLYTSTRAIDNFFNSTITSPDIYARVPDSENTFGFDILKMNLPNKNNTLLNDSITDTSIRLSTKKDGFYLFFVAFETELDENYLIDKAIKLKPEELKKENRFITDSVITKKKNFQNN